MGLFTTWLLCASAAACCLLAAGKPSNVLFLLTDDQDITLGSLSVMPKLQRLVTDKGAHFQNAFVNTPICCPSRAEIQTGRYMHNTGVAGNDCGGDVSSPVFRAQQFPPRTGRTLRMSSPRPHQCPALSPLARR